MDDYKLEIKDRFSLTRLEKITLKVEDTRELNAVYVYNKNKIVINVGSFEYMELTEEETIKKFSIDVTHELLHHLIYDVTDKCANKTEEDMVDFILEE